MDAVAIRAIPAWVSEVAGATALATYLRALGRNATTVCLPEKSHEDDAPASSWRERHLVLLSDSPVHLVTLYAARVGPRLVSLAHHYVVRVDPVGASEAAFETRVGQLFRGIFRKTRSRLSFVGGRLARELQGDASLRATLLRTLASDADLHIVPDLRRGLVRIVHVHPLPARRPLLMPSPTAFHERFLPEELLTAFERIALHVRSVATATSHLAPHLATG